VAALLFVGVAGASGERFPSARLGVAPSSYAGMAFEGGAASIDDDGLGWAEFKYGLRPPRARSPRTILLSANWIERPRGGRKARMLPPSVSGSRSSYGTFSLTHRVNVRISTSDADAYPASSARPLAELVVRGLERRALPRTRAMLAFRPPAYLGRYYLRHSIDYGLDPRKGDASAEFSYATATTGPRTPVPSWNVKLGVQWHERPASDVRGARHWEMTDAERREQAGHPLNLGFPLYSDTHKAVVRVYGAWFDPARRRWPSGFQAQQHRAEAEALARQFLRAAQTLAEPKGRAAEPEPEVEQPQVEAVDVFDANPLFTGGMPVEDIATPGELLAAAKERRVGVCADGVSEVVLRVAVEKPGKVALTVQDGAGSLRMLFGGRTIPDPGARPAKRHFAFARYTPPVQFPPSQDRVRGHDPRLGGVVAYRDVTITARYEPAIRGARRVEEPYRLKIVRPPVLLVHGTFDNPKSCWQTSAPVADTRHGTISMVEALQAVGFAPFLVDFQRTNGSTRGDADQSSFAHNRRVLWANPGGIYDALRAFREGLDVATTQVDVVGHSLGGLIPRLWVSDGYNPRGSGGGVRFSRDGTTGYRRVDNFGAGDIHRLVTICTPHLGSDLGHLALVFRSLPRPLWKHIAGIATVENAAVYLAQLFGYDVTDVVRDQLPHLRQMPNGALVRIGQTRVPAHAIVGWARLPDLDSFGGSYKAGLHAGLLWLLYARGEVIEEFLRVRGQEHDLGRILGEAYTYEAAHRDPRRDLDAGWLTSGGGLTIHDRQVLLNLLRAAIFGNTQNDMVVRVESQVGGLPLKYATQIPGVLHSYATMYAKVQQAVIRLLDGPQREFHADGFPAPSFLRNVQPFTVQQDPAERARAIATSGYVPSHAEALSFVAMQENVVILARPVNHNSTPLIGAHNATKDMHVKGKSSNWGPQKGFIAVEQRFSKLHFAKKDREKDIAKYDGEVKSCLAAGRAKQVPLVRDVGGVRCEVLVLQGVQDAEQAIVLKSVADGTYHGWRNAPLETFDARNAPGALTMEPSEIERHGTRPMMILADRNSGIPLTADYDILAFACRCDPKPPLNDPEMGGIRPYQVELVRRMNNEVRVRANYMGGDVTHHGPENLYDKSPGADYPITAYEPSGYIITIPEGRRGRSDYWLKRYFHHLKARGWFILANPVWRWGPYDPADWPGIGYVPDDRPKPKETTDNPFDSDQGDERPALLPAAGGGSR
jgi:hypothetical protein